MVGSEKRVRLSLLSVVSRFECNPSQILCSSEVTKTGGGRFMFAVKILYIGAKFVSLVFHQIFYILFLKQMFAEIIV